MRSYPRNSPEAAARIVALVLISDGHVCSSEFEVLRQLDAARRLGLAPDALPGLVHTLCEDLLAGAGSGALMEGIDPDTLASLMREIDDPQLQQQVLQLALAAARADSHLADAEALVLGAAAHHWKLTEASTAAAA